MSKKNIRQSVADDLRKLARELRIEWEKLPALPSSKDDAFIEERQRLEVIVLQDATMAGQLLIDAYDNGLFIKDSLFKEIIETWGDSPKRVFFCLTFPKGQEDPQPWISVQCPNFRHDLRVARRGYYYANAMEVFADLIEGFSDPKTDNGKTSSWQFLPGQAAHQNIIFSLNGLRWKILKALVESNKPLMESELIEIGWGHDSEVNPKTLQNNLSAIRRILRNKLQFPKGSQDPIPVVDYRENRAWTIGDFLR